MKIISKFFGKPVIVFLIVIIVFLTFIQLIFSNQVSTSGTKLAKTFTEIDNLERENRDLAVQIYDKGSISQLKDLAAQLGFIQANKFFFVKQNFLVAQNLEK